MGRGEIITVPFNPARWRQELKALVFYYTSTFLIVCTIVTFLLICNRCILLLLDLSITTHENVQYQGHSI